MSKFRVNDMATEFGISAEEVINLLRSMEVPVRSHLSPLTDDQVARVRARWEREKRARERPAAAPANRRRRGTGAEAPAAPKAAKAAKAAPEPAPVPEVVAAAPEAGVRRRRRVETPDAPAEAEAPAEAASEQAAVAAPEVRRPTPVETRTVAPVAAPERAEPEVVVPRPVTREPASVEAAAPAALAPTPAAPAPTPPAPPAPPAQPVAAAPAAPQATPAYQSHPSPAPRPNAPQPVASASPSGAQHPRPMGAAGAGAPPRPVTPGAPRPRPVVPGAPRPRPIASASPGYGGRDQNRGPSSGGGMSGSGMGTGIGNQGRSGPPQFGANAPAGGAAGRRKKGKRGSVDQEAVASNITRTMTAMRGSAGRKGPRRPDDREDMEAMRAAEAERERKTVRVNEFITVSELSQIIGQPPTQIVGFAFKNLGLMVTVNQRLDFDQIELIAGEFGFQAVREEEYQAEATEDTVVDTPEDLVFRPPVVTIMGHVDHGKTSLLDYIRRANVVAGEAGGITQHIGAYHVEVPGKRVITFLDTPGHEAFTAMRARGAQVTDIVVLVVAADDGIMPQTVEAISHAKNAGVPLVVAVNKIDLPQANPARVKQELLQHTVVLEEFGGAVLSTEISAKKGTGVQALLDQILLQSEILDLKANPNRRAAGTVVEAQLDPGKGPVATILVQNGTLKVGDDYICGMYSGRVRAMLDERGKPVKSAGPAIPVQILGLVGVPMAGDQLLVVEDAAEARDVAQRRQRLDREAKSRRTSKSIVSLADFMATQKGDEKRQLNIVIKADQGGPAEALADSLAQLGNAEVEVQIVHRGVGAISESDILLAKASGAIIVGFHVRPDNNARSAAEREGVDIKLYRVIYEAVDDVRAALTGLLRPEEREVILGEAVVREQFKVPKIGTIAGCHVRSGTIHRGGRVRVIRDGVEVYDGTIGSLRRFKEDVKEVKEGYECGIGVENFNDIKVGDVIENYKTEEVARTL